MHTEQFRHNSEAGCKLYSLGAPNLNPAMTPKWQEPALPTALLAAQQERGSMVDGDFKTVPGAECTLLLSLTTWESDVFTSEMTQGSVFPSHAFGSSKIRASAASEMSQSRNYTTLWSLTLALTPRRLSNTPK